MGSTQKPLVVLVSGGCHIPIHFRSFIAVLRDRGYTVLVPALTTSSVGDEVVGKSHLDDVAVIRRLLVPYLDQGNKAILFAHSYGGIPSTDAITGLTVTERASEGLQGGVTGLVYLAAYTQSQNLRPVQAKLKAAGV
jgi:hypothetical protein